MQNNTPIVNIDLTPEYRKNLKQLAKKYRNIRFDLTSLIEELQKGNFLGDRLSGFDEGMYIYKVRIRNSNIQKGNRNTLIGNSR
ncbi:MAG: type II toxin-antitoxin system RelE/ParE family toxin [Microcystaceae cyanobacterium]